MTLFDYRQRTFFTGTHLIGLLVIGAGLLTFVLPFLLTEHGLQTRDIAIGLSALCIGALLTTAYSGCFLDLPGHRYKEYYSICWLRFGRWETMPAISQLRLLSHQYLQSNTANGISPTLSGKVTDYKLFVYVAHEERPYLTFTYTNQDKAETAAGQLAAASGVALH